MTKNILHNIEKNMSSFSKGQKLIARFILENYDKAAFMTASKLGKTVQVSESTVVRFATQLGYEGYPSMQRALQEMIRGKLTSIQRIQASDGELAGSDLMTNVLQRDMEKIRMAIDQTDGAEFERVVDTIIGARRIYIVGFRSSSFLAGYLNFYFRLIFDNVTLVNGGAAGSFDQLFRVSKGDVVIGICFPRYSELALKTIQFARDRDDRRRDGQRDVAHQPDVRQFAARAQRDDLVRRLAGGAHEHAQRTHSGRGQQEGRRHLRDVLRTRAHLGALRHFRQDRR